MFEAVFFEMKSLREKIIDWLLVLHGEYCLDGFELFSIIFGFVCMKQFELNSSLMKHTGNSDKIIKLEKSVINFDCTF